MLFDQVLSRLAHLSRDLPPPPAELTPVVLPGPGGRLPEAPAWLSAAPRREAAVLLLVHPSEKGEAQVVLTERPTGNLRHAGQVSLPGGALDERDESIVAAAMREAREEIGLDVEQAALEVRGVLAPVDVRVSGFLVHPVVASAARQPRLAADPREVVAIIHAPLSAFLPGAPIEVVTAERDGVHLRYGAYRLGSHLVWGATAGILGRFGAFLAADVLAE